MVSEIDHPTRGVGRRYWAATLLVLPLSTIGLTFLLGLEDWSIPALLPLPALLAGLGVQLLPGIQAQAGTDRALWTVLAVVLTILATALWIAALFMAWLAVVCHHQDCFG